MTYMAIYLSHLLCADSGNLQYLNWYGTTCDGCGGVNSVVCLHQPGNAKVSSCAVPISNCTCVGLQIPPYACNYNAAIFQQWDAPRMCDVRCATHNKQLSNSLWTSTPYCPGARREWMLHGWEQTHSRRPSPRGLRFSASTRCQSFLCTTPSRGTSRTGWVWLKLWYSYHFAWCSRNLWWLTQYVFVLHLV